MPVPNPTTLELAQAGALIVGIQRRQAHLNEVLRSTRRWEHWLLILASLILFALNVVALATTVTSDGQQTGPWLAATAGTLSLIGVVIAYTRAAGMSQIDPGFTPEQLSALVGYVDIDDKGGLRTSALGAAAMATYAAWPDPVAEHPALSDPPAEHRPLEAS